MSERRAAERACAALTRAGVFPCEAREQRGKDGRAMSPSFLSFWWQENCRMRVTTCEARAHKDE